MNDVEVRHGDDDAQLAHQETLGRQLQSCVPEIETVEISVNAGRDELFELCASTIRERLGVPVRMVAFGPTERDKVCK
jgi:hypothetical protein